MRENVIWRMLLMCNGDLCIYVGLRASPKPMYRHSYEQHTYSIIMVQYVAEVDATNHRMLLLVQWEVDVTMYIVQMQRNWLYNIDSYTHTHILYINPVPGRLVRFAFSLRAIDAWRRTTFSKRDVLLRWIPRWSSYVLTMLKLYLHSEEAALSTHNFSLRSIFYFSFYVDNGDSRPACHVRPPTSAKPRRMISNVRCKVRQIAIGRASNIPIWDVCW